MQSSENINYIDTQDFDAINVMTIHQAKGLEFPIVFIPSQNERQKKTNILEKIDKLFGLNNNTTDVGNFIDLCKVCNKRFLFLP